MDTFDPEARLQELGITIPEAPPPAAAYIPWTQSGNQLFTAGQIAVTDGDFVARGVVGDTVDLETAQACARQCAINVLAQVKAAAGGLNQIRQILKLNVFVASTAEFTDQHLVANGASEFIASVFGERGRHARSAVGVASLPLNSPVEIEAIVELEEA
jgi:enamine deaminase RidA (YjgF/YER057c/UK114 family)